MKIATILMLVILVGCKERPKPSPKPVPFLSKIDSQSRQIQLNDDTIQKRMYWGGKAIHLRLLIDSLRIEYYKTNREDIRHRVNELVLENNIIIDSLDKYR